MSMRASRRTIVRGMAWGAPVVAVVAAAPAFAASSATYSVTASRGNFGTSPQALRLIISSNPSGQPISGITVVYAGLPVVGSPTSGTTPVTWVSTNNVSSGASGTVTFLAGTTTVTLNFSLA